MAFATQACHIYAAQVRQSTRADSQRSQRFTWTASRDSSPSASVRAARASPHSYHRARGGAMIGNGLHLPSLEPTTQQFLDELGAAGTFPLSHRSAASVRAALTDLQSGPTGKPNANIEDMTFPVGPTGAVSVRIVRPKNTVGIIPVVMFFHGGGWVAGDVGTHDRLVREIAVAVHATVVFVEFGRAPEVQSPIAVEEAYAATAYVVNNAGSLNLDGTRLAVVGDGAGGNMAAAVAIMAKQRRGPKIVFQVLFYPPTAAHFEAGPYPDWRNGPWLTRQD